MSETTENLSTDETSAELPAYKSALLEDVEEAMRDVVDPELGVNVVDLGLVYGIDVDESNVAILDMTLTSAATTCHAVPPTTAARAPEGAGRQRTSPPPRPRKLGPGPCGEASRWSRSRRFRPGSRVRAAARARHR